MENSLPLLEVKDLKTYFYSDRGVVQALNGVDFSIYNEKVLALVGESGCGKSVTALTIMGLIRTPGRIESGEIRYNRNGRIIDLAKLNPKSYEMRSIRGNEIAMIFQEPFAALNPVYTIGDQISESIRFHKKVSKKEARNITINVLRAVGIASPEKRIDEYPHQLSGGMCQRAVIGMALCCNPSLLIADEPTTSLDVTIQAQVLSLMNDLRKEFRTAILFITHNLGVVAHMADDIAIMYLGKIVERASVTTIFKNPRHPYTLGLMKSIPSLAKAKTERLIPIEGNVGLPINIRNECSFAQRCTYARQICCNMNPSLKEIEPGHLVACWLE